MASKYSFRHNAWVNGFGAANTIDEGEFGFNHSDIYFPGIKTCVAVIAKLRLGLCGAHLTAAEDDVSMPAFIDKMAARACGRAASIVLIGSFPDLGRGCLGGSPCKLPAMAATLKQRLVGGGGTVQGPCLPSAPSAPGCDVRAHVANGALIVSSRPQSMPVTGGGGWGVTTLCAI
jgi:hypothetical protein